MSTSAESAKAWTEEKKPSAEQVQEVLTKLESRIDSWEGDEQSIQGSIDAAVFLQGYLDTISPAEPIPSADVSLDTSNLIPDQTPVQLSQEVKQQTFEALKQQLGKAIK